MPPKPVKSAEQIAAIRDLARILSDLLAWSLALVKPGVRTIALDSAIERRMRELGVHGPCKGYRGFPSVSCISVNDQVTHGIPDNTLLAPGDIVDIDLVIEKNGFFADMSRTIPVGKASEDTLRLIRVTEECLAYGIAAAKNGAHLGDIGQAVQRHAEKNGYAVVRDYCGHFIGLAMHEDPLVPNIGKKGKGLRLEPGMILCIEPMINEKGYAVTTHGWDARTSDGSLSSRCEHMVLITPEGNEVLTRFP
ncbi:MAG: type I methionyl aminopeptidase [Spirochaetota bacterium]|jgi:methionyl aminopeptidase|nr:type I methionyl aminopeptidase [Spirochaetota bacterium]